jgi:hypothetical protein
VGLLLGNVASFGRDEDDIASLTHHRTKRGIDDDRFLSACAPVDFRIPADGFALRDSEDRLPEGTIDLFGDLPPKGLPEGLAFDVGKSKADTVQRNLIDFQHRAPRIQKTHELDHGIQCDTRKFLPIPFASVACQKLGAANVDEVGGHERIGCHLRLAGGLSETSIAISTANNGGSMRLVFSCYRPTNLRLVY